MTAALAQRIADEHASVAQSLPANVVALERRREAIDALAAGLPTPRDENWKYANLRPLERVRFTPAASRPAVAATELPPPVRGYVRYVLIDGVVAPELSGPVSPASAIEVHSLRAAARAHAADTQPPPALPADAAFARLNDAFATDGVHIGIAATAAGPACIEVLCIATADAKQGASYPRLHLTVGANAQVGLIERHLSLGSDASFINGAVNIVVHEGASVDHYRVQQAGANALYMDSLSATVATQGTYRLHTASLGALSARSTINVRLSGARSQLALHSLSVADHHQVHDTYALVEHTSPDTRTEESFRGIASGRARVAFNGKIVVREGARGCDSRQSLRGLLAGAQAEIDVRPQLEIYTDDVRCSHGATAGKLDETMLFYLLSRGIDRQTAQHLLKWAFLEDVVSKITVPELRRQIEESLVGRMQESGTFRELL